MNANVAALFQARRALFVGAVMAPLSKWCKKAIPHWIKRDKKESKNVSDNDWSFKDRALPWDDESTVSEEELWDEWHENAMLDIVLIRDGEEAEGHDDFLRGMFLEWNEADIIDSAQSDDARYSSRKAAFFARDEASRYSNDALEEHLDDDDDDVSHLDNDDDDAIRPDNDESQLDNDDDDISRFHNDDSYYREDIYDDLGIDDDDDTSDEWTDDGDSMDEAVDAFLDGFLEGIHGQ